MRYHIPHQNDLLAVVLKVGEIGVQLGGRESAGVLFVDHLLPSLHPQLLKLLRQLRPRRE